MKSSTEDMEDDEFSGNAASGYKAVPFNGVAFETLAESKGRQQLFERQSPQMLKTLREIALIESTESSNRIEGVTVEKPDCVLLSWGIPALAIVRKRRSSDIVWRSTGCIPITTRSPSPETCLRLHALAQGGTSGDAGKWKTTQNEIVEIFLTEAARFDSGRYPRSGFPRRWKNFVWRIAMLLIS